MAFFRQYVAPFIALAIFLIALLAVSVRIFLPGDMAAPAPTEEVNLQPQARAIEFERMAVFPSAVLQIDN